MSSNKTLKPKPTLAFRLTILLGLLFSVPSFASILVFYLLITSMINESREREQLTELTELSTLLSSRGMAEVQSMIDRETESSGNDQIFFRVLSPTGDLLLSSDASSWGMIGISQIALNQIKEGRHHVFETFAIPRKNYKARVLYGRLGPGKILQMGQRIEDEERFVDVFWRIYGPLMAVLTALAALIGWMVARQALHGVKEVTRTAHEISRGSLDQRVQVKAKDQEIEALAATFNEMLDRIQSLMAGIKEISDNIAHDLRSAITRIRGIAEMTLTTGKSEREYEDMAVNTIDECDQLLDMINTMLEISETEAGAVTLASEEIDLSSLLQDVCDLFRATAEAAGLTIFFKPCENSFVQGDNTKLQRLMVNLLDNAVKYTPAGGSITVAVEQSDGQVLISFSDTGIGISKEDLPKIFTRFFRCDPSRSQAGCGLGLNLAKAIVHSHGGSISVTSSPGQGSTFTVNLPVHKLSNQPPIHSKINKN
jgi:heavy metal sensor kinase